MLHSSINTSILLVFFFTVSPDSIQLVAEHAAENEGESLEQKRFPVKWSLVFNWPCCFQVFSMNLYAPFICEFFHDGQEKVIP